MKLAGDHFESYFAILNVVFDGEGGRNPITVVRISPLHDQRPGTAGCVCSPPTYVTPQHITIALSVYLH